MMLGRGAEATVERDGDRCIKERPIKQYRHPDIDARLREERTDQEARLLRRAEEAGVRTPEVLEVTEDTITMEYIEGPKLRDVLEDREELWPEIGEIAGRLHGRNIVHGDLTTSNMIVRDGGLVVIDFGLGGFSERVEDHATDLRLLRQMLEASHPTVHEEVFAAIVDGYTAASDDSGAVLERLEAAESRGRYR